MNSNESPFTVYLEELPAGMFVMNVHDPDGNYLKFKYRNCSAVVGCGETNENGKRRLWATIYRLANYEEKAAAVFLLKAIKAHYTKHKYDFAYSFAQTPAIQHLLYKSGIDVREEPIGIKGRAYAKA